MKSVAVVPAKSGFTKPFGRYETSELMVTRGWMENGSKRYDMGSFKLSEQFSVQMIIEFPVIFSDSDLAKCSYCMVAGR